MFQQPLHCQTVPGIWKESEIRPIPKGRNTPTAAKYLRPIALTSVLVKVMERMVLQHMSETLQADETQYAYRAHRGTMDAILDLTDSIIQHNGRSSGNYTRCLFVDFSSAFNTVIPNSLRYLYTSMPTQMWLDGYHPL